jgi:hypothetical protein
VRRFEIIYGDSGGFTGIEVDCAQQQTPVTTPTAAADTPTPQPDTPTPDVATPTEAGATPTETAAGDTPTATPGGDSSPTPTVAGLAVSPAPVQGAAVAGAESGPGTAVLGAQALPAGGGSPGSEKSMLQWGSALVVLLLVLAASVFNMKRHAG